MYDRLNKLRPDLAGFTDTLKVYICSNHRYGYDYRPVILLEDDDEIEVGSSDDLDRHFELEHLSGFLINIAMRHCWMEDLEPWFTKYHMQFFRLAVRMGHYDLVVSMVDVFKTVDIDQGRQFLLRVMEDIAEHGNLDLLRFILDRFFSNEKDVEVLVTALGRVIKVAMKTGQLSTLQYIHQRFGDHDCFSELFSYSRSRRYEPYETEHLDCWEWNLNLCTNLEISSGTTVVIKNLKVAEKVVNKLGEHSISFTIISASFRYINVETFKYLLTHRRPDIIDDLKIAFGREVGAVIRNETDPELVLSPCLVNHMESKLPPEIVDLIFQQSDLWTRFLIGRLSKQVIEANATTLWNDAFDHDWSGDLQLLPQDGFPTVLTGLCKVKSRFMYDRLIKLRPDLAGFTDTLKVFLRANHDYGYFTNTFRPIILLDDDDEIESRRRKEELEEFDSGLELQHLSGFLINIAMRRCWMEDLEPWVTKYPLQFFQLAVRMGHYDLVVRMVDAFKTVDITEGRRFSHKFMEDIAEHGNLDLLQFILDRFFVNGIDDYVLVLLGPVRKIIKTAMKTGQLSTLQYIQQRFGDYEIFPEMFSDDARGQEYELYETEHLDCWEWNLDLCTNLDITSNTTLVIKNLAIAQKVVDKLGEQSIDFEMISAALESDTSIQSGADLEVMLIKIIDGAMRIISNCWDGGRFNIDLVQCYYKHNPTSKNLIYILYAAAARRNIEVVEFLHSKGVKKPAEPLFSLAIEEKEFNVVQFLSRTRFAKRSLACVNILAAARNGNLETVKFLHRNWCANAASNAGNDGKPCRCFDCREIAQEAFLCAAAKGDYDMVRFFVENRREAGDLELGLFRAIYCQTGYSTVVGDKVFYK
ncbi:hypothetical protein HDU76_012110 [Blyttiomyces sp. JEL0837]|nr:hypothetical protein HDU76_012110 [Blyttiomyces sp. JEL0837]